MTPPSWSPEDVAGGVLWIRPDQGMYQEGSKTTPASIGDPVGAAEDLFGNGYDFTVSGASRPTLQSVTANGKTFEVIRGDGVDDYLGAEINALADFYMLIVLRKRSVPSAVGMTAWWWGSGRQIYCDTDIQDNYVYSQAATSFPEASMDGSPTDWQVIELRHLDQTALTVFINGVEAACFEPNTSLVATLMRILGISGVSKNGDFDIAEIIMYDNLPVGANVNRLRSYIEDRYGINILAPKYTVRGTVLAGEVGNWEDENVLEPTVIYEGNPVILTEETNVFKLWYTGGYSTAGIGYAESMDGINWTKYGSNPIIASGANSSVFKFDSTYYLYVTVGSSHIDLYTSSDGVTFILDTANVIVKSATGTDWDGGFLGNSFVWIEGSTWYMIYDGKSNLGNAEWAMGLATSSDGRTWVKEATNPVISELVNGGKCSASAVTKIGSTYWLWGNRGMAAGAVSDHARWYSTDLLTWTRDPLYYVNWRRLADEGVDTVIGQLGNPFLLEKGGQTYYYYTGRSNGNSQAGKVHIILATGPTGIIGGDVFQ